MAGHRCDVRALCVAAETAGHSPPSSFAVLILMIAAGFGGRNDGAASMLWRPFMLVLSVLWGILALAQTQFGSLACMLQRPAHAMASFPF